MRKMLTGLYWGQLRFVIQDQIFRKVTRQFRYFWLDGTIHVLEWVLTWLTILPFVQNYLKRPVSECGTMQKEMSIQENLVTKQNCSNGGADTLKIWKWAHELLQTLNPQHSWYCGFMTFHFLTPINFILEQIIHRVNDLIYAITINGIMCIG